MNNTNASFCSNYHNTYPKVSNNYCLSIFHVLFVCMCGWPPLPVCIKNTGSAVLNILIHSYKLHCNKEFCPSLEPIIVGSLPLSFLLSTKNAILHVAFPWCKLLEQKSYLRHARSTQIDFGWITLRAQHCYVLSYSMTRAEEWCIHTIKIFQYLEFFYLLS
jgi:hypothetical protein